MSLNLAFRMRVDSVTAARAARRAALKAALTNDDPPPCAKCGWREHCAQRQKSCEAFHLYVSGVGGTRGRPPERIPLRQWYRATFFDGHGLDEDRQPDEFQIAQRVLSNRARRWQRRAAPEQPAA